MKKINLIGILPFLICSSLQINSMHLPYQQEEKTKKNGQTMIPLKYDPDIYLPAKIEEYQSKRKAYNPNETTIIIPENMRVQILTPEKWQKKEAFIEKQNKQKEDIYTLPVQENNPIEKKKIGIRALIASKLNAFLDYIYTEEEQI